jgi:quercetin dioxygenase-like cupin family protein
MRYRDRDQGTGLDRTVDATPRSEHMAEQEQKSGKQRVFVRGLESSNYVLDQKMQERLSAPRVRGDEFVAADAGVGTLGSNVHSPPRSLLSPGDQPFLSQSMHVHTVPIPARDSNGGHAHQNDATFYIVEGAGYEIHDDQRYDWSKGDLVLVHNDSVHQHFNPYDEPALTLVIKTKPTWMFLGLTAQGRHTPPERLEGFGPREDWSALWTPGATELRKIVRATDRDWESTPYGRLKQFTGPNTDARTFSVDVAELEIPPSGHSGKRWQMADEVCYVLEGAGYSLHWEVRAEFAEKYYAHIALEPTRHEISKGQLLYIPPNTVAQHFAADGSSLRLLSGQSRVFRNLGYDSTVFLEKASD